MILPTVAASKGSLHFQAPCTKLVCKRHCKPFYASGSTLHAQTYNSLRTIFANAFPATSSRDTTKIVTHSSFPLIFIVQCDNACTYVIRHLPIDKHLGDMPCSHSGRLVALFLHELPQGWLGGIHSRVREEIRWDTTAYILLCWGKSLLVYSRQHWKTPYPLRLCYGLLWPSPRCCATSH